MLWRKKTSGGALGKLSAAWSYGGFLGVKGRSNEIIVSEASGVWKTRTAQRRSIGDRCVVVNAEQIQFVPWKVHEDDAKADGDVLVAVKLTEEEVAEQLKKGDFDLSDTALPRRFSVTTKLLKEHGFSAKCEGCRAVLENKPKQTHSEECRRILEAIGKNDPRLVAQRQRFDSHLDNGSGEGRFPGAGTRKEESQVRAVGFRGRPDWSNEEGGDGRRACCRAEQQQF